MRRERKLTYTGEPDEILVTIMCDGDAAAFDELYARYSQKMFSYFFRMLWKDTELAEDNVQELFIKLVKNCSGFDNSRSFSTWLYSIANNMCKNEYRKREVRLQHVSSVSKNEPVMHLVNPDLKRFKIAVHNSIQQLSGDRKALYILRFQENLSVPEISAIIDVPEGTVKSRIFYLLKEMKEKLKEFETLHIYP